MLLVCSQLSLLLAFCLPALSDQNILTPRLLNSVEESSPEEEILGYNPPAPYSRYVAKRDQLQNPNVDSYNFNERFEFNEKFNLFRMITTMKGLIKRRLSIGILTH